ncbi:hypothetical protein EV421DRAFT_1741388 [Armillaria borealis]|uniref:Uncharacterized protein n=1 Tax=Armillaria borealis TaxID=47425 RepID=A0AA39J2N1_9AGAR|nr:hypothetical protein EV421DRAFT_1741388 [Armillaria borealis]
MPALQQELHHRYVNFPPYSSPGLEILTKNELLGWKDLALRIQAFGGTSRLRPNRLKISTEVFSNICFKASLVHDQGHRFSMVTPRPCGQINLKVGTPSKLNAEGREELIRRLQSVSWIFQISGNANFDVQYWHGIINRINAYAKALNTRAHLRRVSRRRTPLQFLRARWSGLVTAVISFSAAFVDFYLHFDLDHDDAVKLSVDDGRCSCPQCPLLLQGTRQADGDLGCQQFLGRSFSIDAHSAGIDAAARKSAVFLFDDGVVEIVGAHADAPITVLFRAVERSITVGTRRFDAGSTDFARKWFAQSTGCHGCQLGSIRERPWLRRSTDFTVELVQWVGRLPFNGIDAAVSQESCERSRQCSAYVDVLQENTRILECTRRGQTRSDGGFNGARRDLLAIGLIQVNALVLGVGFFVDPWGSVPVSTFEPSLRVPIHRTYHWQDIHRRPSYLMLRWIRPWFSRLGGGWYDGRTAGQQLRARALSLETWLRASCSCSSGLSPTHTCWCSIHRHFRSQDGGNAFADSARVGIQEDEGTCTWLSRTKLDWADLGSPSQYNDTWTTRMEVRSSSRHETKLTRMLTSVQEAEGGNTDEGQDLKSARARGILMEGRVREGRRRMEAIISLDGGTGGF